MSDNERYFYNEAERFLDGKRGPLQTGGVAALLNIIDCLKRRDRTPPLTQPTDRSASE